MYLVAYCFYAAEEKQYINKSLGKGERKKERKRGIRKNVTMYVCDGLIFSLKYLQLGAPGPFPK